MGSSTYNFTGGWQHFNVPSGVHLVKLTLNGAGNGGGLPGGKVIGLLSVKDTDVLYLLVGGKGKANSGHSGGAGGFGAGGPGGNGVGHDGGDGGGGYALVRKNSTTGTICGVAAGAGGKSGDGGIGGHGGPDTGESGHRGTAGTGATGAATGGTQTQGGNGGTSAAGTVYHGQEASDTALSRGGRGGDPGSHPGHGGGGGGGGYRSGGGGCASAPGFAPGGGGGGGSNYHGPLTSVTSSRGAGSTGNAQIIVEWSDPTGNPRPNTPTNVVPTDGTRLKKNSVTIKAKLSDSGGGDCRMKIYLADNSQMLRSKVYFSDFVDSGKVAQREIDLQPNTRYWAHIYAQDRALQASLGFNGTNFYSDYAPTAPTLVAPGNGHQDTNLGSIVFDWTAHDPDSQSPIASQLRYVREKDRMVIAVRHIAGSSTTYTEDPLFFKSNTFYLWSVRTKDPIGLWGPWATPFRLFITGLNTPPLLKYPINGEAIDITQANEFRWKFRDPNPGDSQHKADLRYRVVDTIDWITVFGTTTNPGGTPRYTFGADTFSAGFRYEWQCRTYDTMSGGSTPSDWSDSERFHAVRTAGDGDQAIVEPDEYQGALGCGVNEAWLAVRGGQHILGKLAPATSIQWGRLRDGISNCTITIPIDQSDCNDVCQLLKITRSWQHEIIVFRTADGTSRRVFEGPITRITYAQDSVQLEAKDVMGYVYRRIMKQGFDDAYPNTRTVVDRAGQIIMNALAPDNPNVLQYLTMYRFANDARESRVRSDWQSTAWAEVDDMAQNAGLDYTTVGRRIILWDTSRPIGKLPLMRSIDFDNAPVLTEYGMLFCTEYGVTNGAGVHASVTKDSSYTGRVELLTSAYGEAAAAPQSTLTAEARQTLVQTLHDQARRGIEGRYPLPLVVRVPDNSALKPEVPVSIDHLVPGVWVPVQADHVCRSITQWQKLDQVTVVQDENGEKVQVVMVPAPASGLNPDDVATAADDSGN